MTATRPKSRDDLVLFCHGGRRAPYVNIRLVSPVRLKTAWGTPRRSGLIHIAEAVASTLDGGRIVYGARWICGGATKDAVLVGEHGDARPSCEVCRSRAAGPVVYRFFDRADAVLYVGSTRSFFSRRRTHEKSAPWWPEVYRETIEPFPSVVAASMAEVSAIRAERPRHNRLHVLAEGSAA